MGKVGRPIGYRESDRTRKQKSNTMMGHKVSEKTKERIRKTMIKTGQKKVSDNRKQAILARYDEKKMRVKDIAELYGVSYRYVNDLVRERDNASEGLE